MPRELSQGAQVASGAVQADLPRLIQPREVAGAQPGWTTNRLQSAESVSYTHLTLPTILRV